MIRMISRLSAYVLAALTALAGGSTALAQSAPTIALVPANKPPPVPCGMKVTCVKGPYSVDSSPTCPVINYLGHTTWAFSFIDNRVAYGVVTYDASNNVLANNTQNGARYVYKITVDASARTVTIWGQADAKVTLPWSALP